MTAASCGATVGTRNYAPDKDLGGAPHGRLGRRAIRHAVMSQPPTSHPRRIANRRRVRPLLRRRRSTLRDRNAKPERLVRRPARRGNLDHPRVVECLLTRIKVRIGPHGTELGGADRVRPGGILDVHGVAHRGQLAVRPGPPVPGPRNVIDLLVSLTVSAQPSLDDLDAVEIGSLGVAKGLDHERGCAGAGGPGA